MMRSVFSRASGAVKLAPKTKKSCTNLGEGSNSCLRVEIYLAVPVPILQGPTAVVYLECETDYSLIGRSAFSVQLLGQSKRNCV
jgi:hypothetical protein